MARLEELTRGASVRGVLPRDTVTVVDIRWHGSNVVELTYKDAAGRLGSELLYRDREPTRYEITHVPAAVRNRDRLIGRGDPMLPRYERVTFEKDLITVKASRWLSSSARAIRCSIQRSTS